ncbi:MAG: M20/M25/M40 family metallo-hydrolase [Archaeoglobus sp.]|nr:M20/M25/M40 family metallo-hydrolase [Archaeoglobus sp.]
MLPSANEKKSESSLDPLELTKQLIKLDSRNPPGNTTRVAEFLEDLFSNYPTRILEKEEGKPNLIVEISKGKPELMLTSHMDTVPAKDSLLNPIIVDGKLYGRGACDAKGCIASIASAVLSDSDHLDQFDHGLKLAFTSDEEVGGVSGLGFVFEHMKSDYVLISEPFGSDRIGVLQAAVVSADLTIRGNSGHTATLDAREGAIYKASEYIIRVMDEFSKLNSDYSDFRKKFEEIGLELEFRGIGHAVFNPAIIRGGVKRNVVAPECKIQADIRFAPWIPQERIREALAGDVEFKINGVLKPYGLFSDEVDVEKDLEFLQILISAIEEKGMKPKGVCSIGVGDTRHVRKHRIPAFYYGPEGHGLHGEDEHVIIEDLYRCSEVFRTVIREFGRKFGGG